MKTKEINHTRVNNPTKVWTNKRTMYELIAEDSNGHKILVQYTNHKGIKHLYHALQDQQDYLKKLFGTLNFERLNTSDIRFQFNNWIVRFTGRTQRDAIHSELPFIRDCVRLS